MASKSKRRGRVFRASCILAALIIAGSSFAWFASKDEVTNRLTANADYGVSIVESYVPPKNILPGQSVNKDVYAVNTGNIGAYVKETLSGKLNYTYEKRVTEAPTVTSTDYVELNENIVKAINGSLVDGATAQEAGAYLAYCSDDTVPLGFVNSATITDYNQSQGETPTDAPGHVVGKRWHPEKAGVYIFKRSIDDTKTAGNGKYKYAGYYYVPSGVADDESTPDVDESEGKYYKIVIGNDAFRSNNDNETAETGYTIDADGSRHFVFDITVDDGKLGANVAIDDETGKLTGSVPVQYLVNKKVVDATPTLTYHDDGADEGGVAYLEATYSDGSYTSAALENKKQALADAEEALKQARRDYYDKLETATLDEVAYENALGDYNTAKSRRDQVKADYEYAKALEDATTDLYAAAKTRADAEVALQNAKNAMLKAYDEMMEEAYKLNTEPTTFVSATSTGDNTKFADIYKAGANGLIDDDSAISFQSIFGTDAANISDATVSDTAKLDYVLKGAWGTTQNPQLLQTVLEYRTALRNKWHEIAGASKAVDQLKTAMNGFNNTNLDPDRTDGINDYDKAAELRDAILEKQDDLYELLLDYQRLYTGLKAHLNTLTTGAAYGSVDDAWLTNLDALLDADDTTPEYIANWITHVDDLEKAIGRNEDSESGATAGLSELIEAYKQATLKYRDEARNKYENAKTDWATAVSDYNTAVSDAQDDYYEAIFVNQITKDDAGNFAKNEYEGLTFPASALGSAKIADYDAVADDVYTGNDKKVIRYLTNNNDSIVTVYSSEKGGSGTYDSGDYNGQMNPQVNDTDGTLWQTIGYSQNVAPKGSTTEAVWDDDATSTPATYTYFTGANTNHQPYVVGEYTEANNGTAIAEKEAFKEIDPLTPYTTGTGTARDFGTLQGLVDGFEAANSDYLTKLDNYQKSKQAKEDAYDYWTNDATDAKNNAQQAVDDDKLNNDESFISFLIYLDDENTPTDYKLGWTSYLMDEESGEKAAFYYNYILEPGMTSQKLVDAIKFDPRVAAKDYKELTFDLNVALESAQITYAENQETVTAAAVDGVDGWLPINKAATGENVVNGITQTEGGKVYWKSREAENQVVNYYVGNTLLADDAITEISSDNQYNFSDDAEGKAKTTFNYKYNDGTKDYYGVNKDGTYYALTTGDPAKADRADTIVITKNVVSEGLPADYAEDTTNAKYSYKIDDEAVTVTDVTKTINGVQYKYKAANGDNSKVYYGTSKAPGTMFYLATDTGSGITLAEEGKALTVSKTTYKLDDADIAVPTFAAYSGTDDLASYKTKMTVGTAQYLSTTENVGTLTTGTVSFKAFDGSAVSTDCELKIATATVTE